jgi:hypothetical protein
MNLAPLANLASGLAVVFAVIFGTLQIRQMAKTRALFTATELVHAMLTAEFARTVRIVMTLPDDADPAQISDDPEMAAAALSIGHVFESLGVLVFHRILPLNLVDDLMGGYVRQIWRKLRRHTEQRRIDVGISQGEWMQWLAERLDEYPSPGKGAGAHVAHRHWRP